MATGRLDAWQPRPLVPGRTARAGGNSSAKTKIPQQSWRNPQPAPIVLVSGPEEVCAERGIGAIRDYLKAEDPSVEVTDIRADDYTAGPCLR